MPVATGGALVLASFVGGRGSRLMGPGLPVLFWGAGVVITAHFKFTGDYALTTALIGLGALAAWVLSERGWPLNVFAVGSGIFFIAVGQVIHGTLGWWATLYVVAILVASAAVELLSIRTDRRDRRTETTVEGEYGVVGRSDRARDLSRL